MHTFNMFTAMTLKYEIMKQDYQSTGLKSSGVKNII